MAIKVSKSRQGTYAAYKASMRWKTNRERKLRKLIKLHPKNLQLVVALKNVSYRRGTPKSPMWTHSMKHTAALIKEFCGSCPHAIFSSNKVAASDAMSVLGKNIPKVKSSNNVSFSIGDRVLKTN